MGGREKCGSFQNDPTMKHAILVILVLLGCVGTSLAQYKCKFKTCDGCPEFCAQSTGPLNYDCTSGEKCQCTHNGKSMCPNMKCASCTLPKTSKSKGGSAGAYVAIGIGILVVIGSFFYYFKVYKKRDGSGYANMADP